MKVSFHIVQARRERLARLVGEHRYLPIRELCQLLGVSEATARRDLAALVREKKITRTYGGALAEFNDRFPSFRERQLTGVRAKTRIARAALWLIRPGGVYFFDSGTTIFALAQVFSENPVRPVTVVTSNIPVGEALAGIPEVQVFQLAGQLLHRQSVLLGDTARRSLEFWQFDASFFSAEGMNANGIWNSQEMIVEQQRAAIRRTRRSIFCLDASKLNRPAPQFLLPWSEIDCLLTDLPQEKLEAAGISLRPGQYLRATDKNPPPLEEASCSDTPETAPSASMPVHIL